MSIQSKPASPELVLRELGLAVIEQAVWDLKYAEKYGTKSLYPEDLMTKEHFKWFFDPNNELWNMLDLDGEAICDRLRPIIAKLK